VTPQVCLAEGVLKDPQRHMLALLVSYCVPRSFSLFLSPLRPRGTPNAPPTRTHARRHVHHGGPVRQLRLSPAPLHPLRDDPPDRLLPEVRFMFFLSGECKKNVVKGMDKKK